MLRPTIRRLGPAALAAVLGLALLTPAMALAADPSSGTGSPAEASIQPTDPTPSASASGSISIDPTFITPTPSPSGAVLAATGRPQHTLPPTDVAVSTHASADARGFALLLLALATICLVAARLPEVRRR